MRSRVSALVALVLTLGLLAVTVGRPAAAQAAAQTPGAAQAAGEQTSASQTSKEMVVGTYLSPPFVMKQIDGEWHGLAIELWQEIARRQSISYRVEEYDLEGLLAALERGEVDVAVGPLLITAHRERRYDMTIPFMPVSLAIATRPSHDATFLAVARSVLGSLGTALLTLLAIVVAFAILVWLLERRRNPEHFGGGVMQGIGDAIWWSVSTMTTVGYGDRTPITLWGRVVGMIWMLSSIVLVSTFIATVTSALTVVKLQPPIRSLYDLAHVRVGVVQDSGTADYLSALGIVARPYGTVEEGLSDVLARELDAFVDEWPVLRYLSQVRYSGELTIVPQPRARGFVGFALPLDSPRRRQLDVAMLEVLDDPEWEDVVQRYLGS
ncbi:MAG TPA: transporter substrate-binding domain-containing protein [Candidatus Binatia bacterium]